MRLLCLGDIAINDNLTTPWLPLWAEQMEDDFRVLFNWELPLSKTINPLPRTSGPRLLSHLNAVDVLQKWTPGIATIATNHILDGDEDGIVETIAALHQAGFETVGAGLTADEIRKPLLWETRQGRLAVVNWVFPETHPEWGAVPGPNCWPGFCEARTTIQSLKSQADWVLILVHWSDELFPYPRPEDRTTVRELAQMGADLVIGHHPHVVRGMEIINSCPIFYSLGNLYFSDFSDHHGGWVVKQAPRNREGLGVQISLERGQKPEYRVLSFWQTRGQVVLDPIRRAHRRMELVSRPLQRFQGSEYSDWHAVERARFDKWGYRWHFGVWQLRLRSLTRFFLRLWME